MKKFVEQLIKKGLKNNTKINGIVTQEQDNLNQPKKLSIVQLEDQKLYNTKQEEKLEPKAHLYISKKIQHRDSRLTEMQNIAYDNFNTDKSSKNVQTISARLSKEVNAGKTKYDIKPKNQSIIEKQSLFDKVRSKSQDKSQSSPSR